MNRKPRRLLVKFMGGPADGDSFEGDPKKFALGKIVTAELRGHIYASRVPWNGKAKAIALWDQGWAPREEPIIV